MNADGAVRSLSPAEAKTEIARLTLSIRSSYASRAYDEALEAAQALLALDPENFIAQRASARIFSQRGLNELAEPIWRGLCETAADKVEPAVYLARISHAKSDWDEMARFADLATRENAGHADALRLAIQARLKAKRTSELPEMLARLHGLDADRTMTLLRSMGGHDMAEAQASALILLRQMKTTDPILEALTEECREAWRQGSERAGEKRDDTAAAGYLRAMLAFDPDQDDVAQALDAISRTPLRRLRKAIKQGGDADVLETAEAAVAFNPRLFEGWYAIARLTSDDQPDRAADGYGVCARLRPDDIYCRYLQGMALLKAGRVAEAIDVMDDVIARIADPDEPIRVAAVKATSGVRRDVYNLAIDEARAGRIVAARAHYLAARSQSVAPLPTRNPLTLSDRVTFWIFLFLASVRNTARSSGGRFHSIWALTKRRSARVRDRILGRRGGSASTTVR